MFELTKRAAWGARAPEGKVELDRQKVKEVAVHYSAAETPLGEDHQKCAGRVRAIQKYHMDTRDYSDIAYNFLVCQHGGVFEGRGWDVKSGATYGANHYTIAVCYLGADKAGRRDTTDAAYRAIHSVIVEAKKRYPIEAVQPHSAYKATSCPGDEIRAWISKGYPYPHAAGNPPQKPYATIIRRFDGNLLYSAKDIDDLAGAVKRIGRGSGGYYVDFPPER